MSPFGRQWFSLGDRSADAMLGGQNGSQILDDFLNEQLEKSKLTPKISADRFQPGYYDVSIRWTSSLEQIARIVGTGRLLAGDLLKKEIKTSPPVTLIHGAADEMVPAEALQHAVKGLEDVGITVTSELRLD